LIRNFLSVFLQIFNSANGFYSFYFYLADNDGKKVVEMIVPCLAARPVLFDRKIYDYIYYKFIEFYKDCPVSQDL